MVGCGTLAGKNAAMGLLVGLGSLLAKGFLVISWGFGVFPLGLELPCWRVPLSSGVTLFPLLVGNLVWRLPTPGHVVDILTTGREDVGLFAVEPLGGICGCPGASRHSFKRVRLTKRTRRPIAQGRIPDFSQPIPWWGGS